MTPFVCNRRSGCPCPPQERQGLFFVVPWLLLDNGAPERRVLPPAASNAESRSPPGARHASLYNDGSRKSRGGGRAVASHAVPKRARRGCHLRRGKSKHAGAPGAQNRPPAEVGGMMPKCRKKQQAEWGGCALAAPVVQVAKAAGFYLYKSRKYSAGYGILDANCLDLPFLAVLN